MDPLTHTLVGANLAGSRLGEATRLAVPALVIGANLPDLDAIFYFTGHDDFALGFRRGWTHGILALVVLPIVLTGLLLLYDRLRPDPARKVRPGWLLALSGIAILTHPTLDWLNNYGMRWLMPFDGTWTYGDAVFIMDPLLWLILGVGWLAGRKPSGKLLVTFALITAAIAWVVGARSTSYLPLVGAIALILLLALLWKPGTDLLQKRHRLAAVAIAIAAVYIGGRLALNEATEAAAVREMERRGIAPVERIMASPHPLDPTRWEIVAETGDVYRYGGFRWMRGGLDLSDERIPVAQPSPEWEAAQRAPEVQGFHTWARFPWYSVERTPAETRVYLSDARYARRRTGRGFGGAVVVIPTETSR